MRRLARAQPPGQEFHYSTVETDLAGCVLSRAVGMSMSNYLTRRIWAPFGMESDATWLTDAAGHQRSGCCLSMTLRDYARVGLFMLADGAGVLPAGWVKDATLPHLQVGDGSRDHGYFGWITGNT
ncbi:MAG: serine hydrolase [Pseudomonadales bacterium]|nr:serine hydrolase [Pseudomonadales bacterium]